MSALEQRRAIARRLSQYKLQYAEEEPLNPEDLMLSLDGKSAGGERFLGYYSPEGLDYALRAYGVYQELSKRGFDKLVLHLDCRDPFAQRLSLFDGERDNQHLIHELLVRRRRLRFDAGLGPILADQSFEFLAVDWICLQNPRQSFDLAHPRLPGQTRPGLRMGALMMDLIRLSAERLELAGVSLIPAWLHNAVMYHPVCRFLVPAAEGRLQALIRDLVLPQGLADASWAVENGLVQENGMDFAWFHLDQVMALEPRLQGYFRSPDYQAQVKTARLSHHYQLRDMPPGAKLSA
ncbi:MAG: hypothetical protein CVV27_09495 [Candidatus Melainabacteria bacterium HGW-Melainabacteria-1]|nr:MAG: hypothetical protein CVV27_09495 [Candidatus Melainabacteria bacterium HGW-Melainabacteria-1]